MIIRARVVAVNLLVVIALLSILPAGCAGQNGGKKIDVSQPPQIPPQSTFIMDFSDFSQGSNSMGFNQLSPSLWVSMLPETVPAGSPAYGLWDHGNWGFAALNVGFWNLMGVLGLAIPVAAFVESYKQTPVKQADNSWVWTYSLTLQGITYTAELHGKYIDTGVRWDMYITKQNEYTDFLWYYGECNNGATRGYWVLKDKPANPNSLLRIDWQRNPLDETGYIKYTNIVPGGPDNGGYISFKTTLNSPYDRDYQIFNKGKNQTTYIEWNESTKAGRVKDNVHFGDNEWHYWDAELKDTQNP